MCLAPVEVVLVKEIPQETTTLRVSDFPLLVQSREYCAIGISDFADERCGDAFDRLRKSVHVDVIDCACLPAMLLFRSPFWRPRCVLG